ncbi:MAG: AAA domain-containing protein [Opitutae bacterium]|jgi:MoxR-like ATPase|nr:AAA domain-containing protein [Opitutae bacterium]MBT5692121.1 AAA domain-containing protein [Opitutae bacterium]
MFDQIKLAAIAEEHQAPLMDLSYIEDALRSRYGGADDAIRALVLSVACGEPLLFIGPPGTGKSQLIRDFCALSGIDLSADATESTKVGYFEYLLTPFTEPSELFGFYDIPSLQKGSPQRLEAGMMQNARIVYLDEVFNGSSAILNSILTFMNERTFHERGIRRKVAMEYMFGATNLVPETGMLKAVFDRFLIRCRLVNVPNRLQPFKELIHKGWWQTYGQSITSGSEIRKNAAGEFIPFCGLLEGLAEMRSAIRDGVMSSRELHPQKESDVYAKFMQLVEMARSYGLSEMSNRRIIKLVWVLCIHKMYTTVRKNIRTCSKGKLKSEKQWDIWTGREWDPMGPFSAQELIQGIKGGTLSPMTWCCNKSRDTQHIKDAIKYERRPMPKKIAIANEDLMLIPKFFLDKEDPELALKMERTLVSAEDYGS